MKLFKKISHHFFPQQVEIEKNANLFTQMTLLFGEISISKTDQEVINLYNRYAEFSKNLTDDEKTYFKNILKKMNEIFTYIGCMIQQPKEASLALDQQMDEIMRENKETHSVGRTNLLNEIASFSFQCASLSIVALMTNKLTEDEKENHISMQQGRLNIALQHNWHGKHEVNYWYGLHCYLKGNKENAKFFLKNLFKDTKTVYNMGWLVENNENWLRNKIPKEFHEMVQESFNESLQIKKQIKP